MTAMLVITARSYPVKYLTINGTGVASQPQVMIEPIVAAVHSCFYIFYTCIRGGGGGSDSDEKQGDDVTFEHHPDVTEPVTADGFVHVLWKSAVL